MKKFLSITTLFVLLTFTFVISSEAFFCDENNQVSKSAQAPVHCCVQCCPSHNLASPTVGIVQVMSPDRVTPFVVENLDLPIEIYPNRIDRPPIA